MQLLQSTTASMNGGVNSDHNGEAENIKNQEKDLPCEGLTTGEGSNKKVKQEVDYMKIVKEVRERVVQDGAGSKKEKNGKSSENSMVEQMKNEWKEIV